MADPITLGVMAAAASGGATAGGFTGILGAIGLAGTAAGAGTTAYGAYQGGRFKQSMYNYQSHVASLNADIEANNARYELAKGEVTAQTQGLKSREQIGETRAKIAAGNLDTGTGSARQVVNSEEELAQHNQAIIRNDAARRAYGYEVQGTADVAQANLDTAAGQGEKTASEFQVASSILGGASSVSDKWINYNKAGVFG